MIAHWDDAPAERLEEGHLSGTWSDLGEAAGSVDVGVTRIRIDPGRWSTPAHVELDEEEIFFVLAGSGLSWQNGETFEVGPGDVLVHRVSEEAHTLRAGDDGLDVLAFGERTDATATYLPRAKVLRMGPTVDVSGGPHPWEREAAAGEPDVPPAPSERPGRILNVTDVEPSYEGDAGKWLVVARKAGAVRSGLNWGRLEPGREGAPPHCHSADEEIFVVLDGGGTLELWPPPLEERERERHELRAGHVVSRPPSTGFSHHFRAGDEGMTFLAYGTRRPNDICYYPRSNKIYWRGVGLVARLEPLAFDDGEPSD